MQYFLQNTIQQLLVKYNNPGRNQLNFEIHHATKNNGSLWPRPCPVSDFD